MLNFYKGETTLKSIPRIVSSLTSLMIFFLTLKLIGKESFAHLQSMYAVGGFILWVVDFGLLKSYSQKLGQGDFQASREIFSLRIYIAYTVLIFPLLLGLLKILDFELSLLMLVAILDLFTESFLDSRVLDKSNKQALLIQLVKKLTLLISIILMLAYRLDSLVILATVYGSFCTVLIIYENLREGNNFKGIQIGRRIKDSLIFWRQSVAASVSGLDTFIMNLIGTADLVVIYSGLKKIANYIAVFGGTQSVLTLYYASRGIQLTELFTNIRRVSYHAFLMSIVTAFTVPLILSMFLSVPRSTSHIALSVIIIVLTPIGILNSNINSILLGTQLTDNLVKTTLSISLCYLSLLLTLTRIDESFGVAVSLIFSHFAQLIYFYGSYVKILQSEQNEIKK